MPTPTVYAQHKLKQFNGAAVIDYDTDDIRIYILTSTYAPSTSHAFVSDLTNHVTGTGAPGTSGTSVANKTYTLSGSTASFIHDDVTITQSGSGFTNGRFVVWAKWTGTNTTSPLMMYLDNGSDFGNVSGDLIIDGSAVTGVVQVS